MMARLIVLSACLLLALPIKAADALTSLHPEAAYPDNAQDVAADQYTELNKSIQQALHEHGFDAGPVNGEFDSKTQAALAQFQLSAGLPASGMRDGATLAALGIEPPAPEE